MKASLTRYLRRLLNQDALVRDLGELSRKLDAAAIQQAQVLRNMQPLPLKHFADAEFRIFSQWGDDGLIQYLVRALDLPVQQFIEFGVEDYRESNTRLLMELSNWKGLVMDGSDRHVASIKSRDWYWRHDLTAVSAFVTAENINSLIADAGFGGRIGLLHIDIDGMDYWVWDALNVVEPDIAIIEFNSVLGSDRAITVPYEPKFIRSNAHHSGLYCGASLSALCALANRKGMFFVGTNSVGNNAYFLHRRHQGVLPELDARTGYVESRFRESRRPDGQLSFVGGEARSELIRGLPVFNVDTGLVEPF